jgi:CubicO group peptidase (beta-lactamase class C family)
MLLHHNTCLLYKCAQKAITVRHLLTHTSGLRPGIGYKGGAATMQESHGLQGVTQTRTRHQFVLYDINFILLGEIVRTVSNKRIDEFALENIYKPLGMVDTCYNPPLKKQIELPPPS